MPTPRQQKVVENITENYRSKGELLQASGYSESTSLQPSRILNSKGIQALAEKAEGMGINDDLTLSRVKEAMQHRNLQLAINTIFNWWRVIYPNEKPETQVNIQQNIIVTDEMLEREAIELLESKGYKIEK